MGEKSIFDEAVESVDDIGKGAKFDDAVKAADKAFELGITKDRKKKVKKCILS